MKNEDFFFGKKPFNLNDWRDLASSVSQDHFTAQLNRYLNANDNFLEIMDGTSHPDFSSLLGAISPAEIGNIRIFARSDQNDALKATLACDILLVNGVVRVTPQWCAYKEIRSSEIISSLLVPIHARALQDKTYVVNSDGTMDKLPKPSVDTGMGLERTAAILQGKHDNYDKRLIKKIVQEVEEGLPRKEANRIYGLGASTLNTWMKKYASEHYHQNLILQYRLDHHPVLFFPSKYKFQHIHH